LRREYIKWQTLPEPLQARFVFASIRQQYSVPRPLSAHGCIGQTAYCKFGISLFENLCQAIEPVEELTAKAKAMRIPYAIEI
jgi:hypothetical protein